MPLAKKLEICNFENLKFSGKKSKNLNSYKIKEKSQCLATLQKESLWTLEGFQSKKPLVSCQTI
jgi:hypothetical protein